MKKLFCLIFLVSCAHLGKTPGACPMNGEAISPKTRCYLFVDQVRATQPAVSLILVQQRTLRIEDQYQKFSLKKYIDERVAPTIIGPDGQYFIIDRHHLSRSLYESRIPQNEKRILVEVISNLNHLSEINFWQEMEKSHWVYLKGQGQEIQFTQLPTHISQLPDDPYRTLATFVQEAGGFKKEAIPYLEFYWGDFFRTQIQLPKNPSRQDILSAVPEALKISRRQRPTIP